MNNKSILSEANDLFEYSRALRRDFHQYPETGFQEIRTAGIVCGELAKFGIQVKEKVGKTGVIGLLQGEKPGPTALLRFDMDALPIQEENQTAYCSRNPGVMHACGHDGHMAAGITAARMLAQHRHELRGQVKFMFQPAEEGLGGALAVLADGVMKDPVPDYALAIHLWNELPLGVVGITSGPLMAGSDTFSILVEGRGGHGALPQLSADPVFASAQIISSLQSVVSRNISPLKAAVVSVTCVRAGSAANVIPQKVEMKGTIRTFESEVREHLLNRCTQIVSQTAAALGCSASFENTFLTPPVVNDPTVTGWVIDNLREVFPGVNIHNGFQTTVSEDMAFVLQQVPGCYMMIGSANREKGLDHGHHHPCFDFDEDALPLAAAFITGTVLKHQV